MTVLLEKAFSEAQKLSDHEQDVLASIIIDELLATRKWDEAFAGSQEQLEKLAEEALADLKAGKTKPMQFN